MSTTACVRAALAPFGSVICVISTPWSSSGTKERRQVGVDQIDAAADGSEDDEHAQRPRHDLTDRADIAARGAGDAAVEPAEPGKERPLVALRIDGLEDRGAERRRQDDRHQHRQQHGRGDGDGELAVDDADRAAEEGHGNEHRGQHQRDADQRAGDLAHGFLRRLAWRQSLLAHDALDVLDHDDGVVDQKADRQHHGEHGQHVDRVAEGREHAEGAQQHHRNRDHRDEGGAEVLQEDEKHDEDQHDGFDQRLDHLLDRLLDEGCRLVGIGDDDALGQRARRGCRVRRGRRWRW